VCHATGAITGLCTPAPNLSLARALGFERRGRPAAEVYRVDWPIAGICDLY